MKLNFVIPFLLIFLAGFLLLSGCSASESQNISGGNQDSDRDSGYRRVSMSEAVDIMATESDYIILDVRTPEEFSDKHIPDAVNIPNETIGTEEIDSLPNKDQLILVYCRSGNRSKQASEKLADLGYTNVVEFGGINDWTGETVSE